jgi:hypothetical protein
MGVHTNIDSDWDRFVNVWSDLFLYSSDELRLGPPITQSFSATCAAPHLFRILETTMAAGYLPGKSFKLQASLRFSFA